MIAIVFLPLQVRQFLRCLCLPNRDGVYVPLRRSNRLMAQPIPDHIEVNPALAKEAGHRVPEQVGMDLLQPEVPCGIAHDPANLLLAKMPTRVIREESLLGTDAAPSPQSV